MVITLNIPDAVNSKLEAFKRQTGMSKSLIVRQILLAHFKQQKSRVA
jgi:predicted DNA-binding protein